MNLPNATCTVVIPCYNGEKELARAVESLRAQTYQDFQVVLVDDGSTDGTRALMNQLAAGQSNITVVGLDQNVGRARARNLGVEAASSQFVSFLDHDDTYEPDFLKTTVPALASSVNLDAVKVLANVSVPIDPVRYQALVNSMVTAMVIRRTAYEFMGGYPESAVFRTTESGLEDVAFMRLFYCCFFTGHIPVKLYNYIIRPGNALERFLARSAVVDGKLKFTADAVRDDSAAFAEMDRLEMELRIRIRDWVRQTGGRGLERLV
jgi:glycosyltransferase involved in cell wall biosynthesis